MAAKDNQNIDNLGKRQISGSSRFPAPISREEITRLFHEGDLNPIRAMARAVCEQVHGRSVFLRGLIEFTNFCTANCLYCGIRRDNKKINRYRLDEAQILDTIDQGQKLNFKTFVLQGGEDPQWPVDRLGRLVESIKKKIGDQGALTLSCGMKTRAQFQQLFDAGADRYLLRFETSDPALHSKLRDGQTLEMRLEALENIRAAGFQVGSGFMLGLPGETQKTRLNNILLCQSLKLGMVGIGPFIPHPDTPLAEHNSIDFDTSLQGTALLRLALPLAHIPATTAAGSIVENGREEMILSGANVLMPNITPKEYKKSYLLYPGKICLNETGAQSIASLATSIPRIGRRLNYDRADTLTGPGEEIHG